MQFKFFETYRDISIESRVMILVKMSERDFPWNHFHENFREVDFTEKIDALYICFGITSQEQQQRHILFHFFKVLHSSFLFLLSIFFVSSARLPPYFRVSNFFSLLFLLDKKWIGNFFHHTILILLYKLISFLSEWWIKSATNFNAWSRSVLWNINENSISVINIHE